MANKEDINDINKQALIDEMAVSINNLNEFINDALETKISPDGNIIFPFSSLVGVSHQVGYLTAVFNQFVVFERGPVTKEEKKVGFRLMESLSRKREEDTE